jgi:manganese/iron transport system permease protein
LNVFEWLGDPFAFSFMQRGLAAALIVGTVCPIIGCFVVLRGMAFLGDAMAHAILPGVAVAYLLKADLSLGALAAAVLTAFGINAVSRRGGLKEDTAIGILFSAALAMGVALISSIRTYAVDLSHILFGNLLGVSDASLVMTAGIGLLVSAVIAGLYRQFVIVSFDPVLAKTLRLPVNALRSLLLLLLALTIVVSIQSVGVGLVSALLVTPAAAAYLFVRRLGAMMLLAAVIGAVSSLAGLYLSYYANIASGSAIVLVATLFFMVAWLAAPRKGLLARRFARRKT